MIATSPPVAPREWVGHLRMIPVCVRISDVGVLNQPETITSVTLTKVAASTAYQSQPPRVQGHFGMA